MGTRSVAQARLQKTYKGFMMVKLPVYLLVIFFIFSGFTWPGQKKEAPAKKTAPKQTSAPVPQAPEAGEDEESEEDLAPVIPQLPQVPKIPQTNIPGTGYAKNSAIPALPADIVKIQSEIKEITEMNERLKSQYKDQASEIQKISDQARIHQRILQELQEKNAQNRSFEKTDAMHILEQEKIRAIQKETEEKKQYLQNLDRKAPVPSAQNLIQGQQKNGVQS